MSTPEKEVMVFYANLLYGRYTPKEFDFEHMCAPQEIYNGAFVLFRNLWWRMDKTPYPEEQVPNETRALALLLT